MLILFHDYTSPGSAVAVARLQRLADEGLAIAFEGFEAVGVDMTVPVTLDVVAATDELADAAAAEGVRLRRPASLPPTGLAHVLGDLAEANGLGASWRKACYRAFWTDGADIGDRAVLGNLAAGIGLDRDHADSALADRVALASIRRRTGGHRRDGVGGVPTILAQRTLVPGLVDEGNVRALATLEG